MSGSGSGGVEDGGGGYVAPLVKFNLGRLWADVVMCVGLL